MEMFGILFAVPVAFAASAVYAAFVVHMVRREQLLASSFSWVSVLVLAGLGTEMVLLAILGPVKARELLGYGYVVGHMTIFVLGLPALANVMLLRRQEPKFDDAAVAVLMCCGLAFCLVLMQYHVMESLYGHDGKMGPYSHVDGHSG